MLNIIHNYKDSNNSNWILARHPCSCFGPLFPGQFEGLVSKKGAEPEDQEGKKGGGKDKNQQQTQPTSDLGSGIEPKHCGKRQVVSLLHNPPYCILREDGFHLVMSSKEKILSSYEESNLRPSDYAIQRSSAEHRDYMVSKVITKFIHNKCPVYCWSTELVGLRF